MTPEQKKIAAIVLAAAVVGVLVLVAYNPSGAPNNATPGSTTTVPAVAPALAPSATTEDAPLSRREAATALSEYLSEAQARIQTMGMMNDLYITKIKQDIEWGSLDKYRGDAEAMKEMAQNAQQQLSQISYPTNLADDQAEQFEAVASAISDLAAAFVSMDVDVAVNAHTGMNVNSEIEKDIREFKKAQRQFKEKALAAYKFFGYRKNEIDMTSLRPKKSSPQS